MSASFPVSILILTLNEIENITECLGSLRGFGDIVILDSFSSDGTQELARNWGARVVERPFDNWASHQNWAMKNIEFKYPWVFYLDADERMTAELRDEIMSLAVSSPKEVAYYCSRRNFFMGKWIRHCYPPVPLMRFFRPSKVRFERLVNPVAIIDGPHGYLKNRFDHYNFSKGLEEWFAKHNRYSTFEAIEGIKVLRGGGTTARLFTSDRASRIQWLKRATFNFPCRGLLKFIYLFIIKFGFLDGRAGFLYCRMQMVYEFMISAKMQEIERKEKGLPV